MGRSRDEMPDSCPREEDSEKAKLKHTYDIRTPYLRLALSHPCYKYRSRESSTTLAAAERPVSSLAQKHEQIQTASVMIFFTAAETGAFRGFLVLQSYSLE